MGRKLIVAFSAAFALMIAMMLGACAANDKADVSEYTGTLVTAYQNQMVLAGDQGDMEFVTSENTKYNMETMYLDDVVSVKYHVDDKGNQADEVLLVEHMDPAIPFAGTLVEVDDDSISLASKKMTVTFLIDEDSYIVGDLSKGDEVELMYLGDINEYPYANVVAVVKEVEQPKTHTVHGAVAELAGGTLLLSIDSAHAYRFVITSDTQISGAANDLAVGDEVDVTYEGNIKQQPNAQSVKIVKRPDKRTYVINGKIDKVENAAVTLDTGQAKYAFATNNDTKFYGEKPANGYKAEITYTGNLNDKPVATIIYSVKDEKSANKATTKKDSKSSKASSASSSKASSSSTAKKDSKSTSEKSEPKKSEAAQSESSSQQSSAAEEKSESSQEASKKTEDKSEQKAETPEKKQPVKPEADEPEPQTEPEGDDEQAPEPEGDEPAADEPTVEPEDEPTADETGDEPAAEEPEPEPEAEEPEPAADEPEPEPEPEPAAEEPEPVKDVGVSGQGTIIKVNEKKKTYEVEIKGKKITLKADKDTKVSSGYTPQEGDVVKVEYGSESLTLKKIQLVDRAPEPKAEAEDAKAEAENAEAAEDEATEEADER